MTIPNPHWNFASTFEYNSLNQLTKTIASSPFSYQTKYSYDENGNLEKLERQTQDPQNPWQTTQYSYTALDQLESIKQYLNPASYLETKFTYDLNGNRSSITDANNKTTAYQYDERNLIWKTTDSLNYTTEYTYDPNGNLSITKDSKLNETKYDYDDFDRLQKSTFADSSFKQFGYDKNSNLTNLTNPANQTIIYAYDVLNRLDLKTYPDATQVDYGYDLGSRLRSVVYGLSTVDYTYDSVNRISSATQTVNSLPFTVNYQYDPVGNRKKLTTPSGLMLNYDYDELNRLTSIKDLASSIKTAHYSYDALSRRIRLFLSNNTFTNYEYDSLNRLTQLSNKACISNCSSLGGASGGTGGSGGSSHPRPFLGPPVLGTPLAKTQPISDFDYTYDNVGNRLTMTTLQGTETYGYDSVYQLDTVSGTQTHSYQYDSVGNRTKLTQPSGLALDYTYDELNRLTKIYNLQSQICNYSYDALSRRIRLFLENNTFTTYEYDSLNRLTKLSNKACLANCSSLGGSSGGTGTGGPTHPRPFLGPPVLSAPLAKTQPISDFDYTYDNVGNRLTMTTLQGTDNYGYDSVYQLGTVSGAQTHSYQYDPVGNRQLADGITYTPNNLNQYSDVGGTTYTYDSNGNLTNDGVYTFGYDYENRLTLATGSGNNAAYGYDGLGRRISKTVNGVITYFIYDGDQIIEERNASGTLLKSYIYGVGIDEVLASIQYPASSIYYYHYDGLGSVTNLTNSTNSTIESYSYDVYGMPSQLSTIGNRFYFTGREFDAETGLYHYRNRTYSPTIGRFLQRDPIEYYDSMNLYEYVGNSPVNFMDPYGLYQYDTPSWLIAFLHESNPFNVDSAIRQQMSSWGKFYSGDWAGAAALSGQSIVEKTNKCGKASGWQIGYNAAQIAATVAAITAAGLIGYEATTGIRIEFHLPHAAGPHKYPHLQGIKGPGWGKTIWRFP